jgi:hypothetical protein
MEALSGGWVICRTLAAFEMDPCRAISRKYRM